MALFAANWSLFLAKIELFAPPPSIYIKYVKTPFKNYTKVIKVGFEFQGGLKEPKMALFAANWYLFLAKIELFAPPPSIDIKYVHISLKNFSKVIRVGFEV